MISKAVIDSQKELIGVLFTPAPPIEVKKFYLQKKLRLKDILYQNFCQALYMHYICIFIYMKYTFTCVRRTTKESANLQIDDDFLSERRPACIILNSDAIESRSVIYEFQGRTHALSEFQLFPQSFRLFFLIPSCLFTFLLLFNVFICLYEYIKKLNVIL